MRGGWSRDVGCTGAGAGTGRPRDLGLVRGLLAVVLLRGLVRPQRSAPPVPRLPHRTDGHREPPCADGHPAERHDPRRPGGVGPRHAWSRDSSILTMRSPPRNVTILDVGGMKEGPDTGESGPLFVFRLPRGDRIELRQPRGSCTLPRKRIVPVCRSLTVNANGRSTRNGGGPADSTITPPVTAAASVPSSSTRM